MPRTISKPRSRSADAGTAEPWMRYVDDVLTGRRTAGRLERLAVERFVARMDRESGLFDADAVRRVIRFFHLCPHVKGTLAGKPYEPQPWEAFVLANLFGWKKPDGSRATRSALVMVARKNSKSSLIARVGLYLLTADGEAVPEVFSAATTRDQASILWTEACRTAAKSPHLARITRRQKHTSTLTSLRNDGSFRPLAGSSDNLDGLNPHGALIDELHAHKTSEMVGVLRTALGARRQPLLVMISTAGVNPRTNPCKRELDYAEAILTGKAEDDSYFAFVCQADDPNDWRNYRQWEMANPNLGKSVSIEDMADQAKKAELDPAAKIEFLIKKLNCWVDSLAPTWIDAKEWDACRGEIIDEMLADRPAAAGLDGADRRDLCAYVTAHRLADGRIALRCRASIPRETMVERVRVERVNFESWERSGWLTVTEGMTTDFDALRRHVLDDFERWSLLEVGYDPRNLTQLGGELQAGGMRVCEMLQSSAAMNEPSKLFRQLVTERRIVHDGNQVFAWCISNTAFQLDRFGNGKPVKADGPYRRIDLTVAAIMAVWRLVCNERSANESFAIIT